MKMGWQRLGGAERLECGSSLPLSLAQDYPKAPASRRTPNASRRRGQSAFSGRIALFVTVGAVGLGWTPALAGYFYCDFNSDPSSILTIIGNGEWRPRGGIPEWPEGYLAITDALDNQATKIVFADFDQGMPVKAFSFSCDLRIGNANGCSGRTGGCNENQDVDNVEITTIPAVTIEHSLIGLPVGFRGLTVIDGGAAVVDTNTILLKFDGVLVTPREVIKSGAITTIGWWDLSAPLPVGSIHTVSLSVSDTQGNLVSWEGTVVIPSYVTLPPEYAVTDTDTSKLILHNGGDGTMTLEWWGGATLQTATSVLGHWLDVDGACSPFTVVATEKTRFFRLKR